MQILIKLRATSESNTFGFHMLINNITLASNQCAFIIDVGEKMEEVRDRIEDIVFSVSTLPYGNAKRNEDATNKFNQYLDSAHDDLVECIYQDVCCILEDDRFTNKTDKVVDKKEGIFLAILTGKFKPSDKLAK